MPVASMASVRSGGFWLVSPMTRAGSRPRASEGNGAAASRSPVRRRSAALATSPGAPSERGVPRGRRTATTSSPGSAATRVPCTPTRSCHRTASQASSAMTSTGVETRATRPRPVTSSTRRVKRTVEPSNRLPPTTTGSLVTTPETVTMARCVARARTGPASRADAWPAVAARTRATAPMTSAPSAMEGLSRIERQAGTPQTRAAAMPALHDAATTSSRGRTPRVAALTAHAVSAGTSMRRSSRRR